MERGAGAQGAEAQAPPSSAPPRSGPACTQGVAAAFRGGASSVLAALNPAAFGVAHGMWVVLSFGGGCREGGLGVDNKEGAMSQPVLCSHPLPPPPKCSGLDPSSHGAITSWEDHLGPQVQASAHLCSISPSPQSWDPGPQYPLWHCSPLSGNQIG